MILRLSNVRKSLGGRTVLADANLDLAVGECVCLVGPSDLGKSTLLTIAAGILLPETERVERPPHIAISFQDEALLPWADALGNLLYALAALPDAKARAHDWLTRFDLPPLAP